MRIDTLLSASPAVAAPIGTLVQNTTDDVVYFNKDGTAGGWVGLNDGVFDGDVSIAGFLNVGSPSTPADDPGEAAFASDVLIDGDLLVKGSVNFGSSVSSDVRLRVADNAFGGSQLVVIVADDDGPWPFTLQNAAGGFWTLYPRSSDGRMEVWDRTGADTLIATFEASASGGGFTVDTGDLTITLGKTTLGGDLAHTGTKLGFYATVAIVKQTGVAVTAAGIHAALVNLGLIAA